MGEAVIVKWDKNKKEKTIIVKWDRNKKEEIINRLIELYNKEMESAEKDAK